MNELTRIAFDHRRVRSLEDLTDLAELMFPRNKGQQYAAARILLQLKAARGLLESFHELETRHGISRRTLQRTRARLARLGLIERVTWMNSRYGGRNGWRLSSRMSTGLRGLADRIDRWRDDVSTERLTKEASLAELLQPSVVARNHTAFPAQAKRI